MKHEKILQLNKEFEINGNNGINTSLKDNEKYFSIKKRKGKIMISAPHTVNHYRDGELLKADMLTGGITLYLSEGLNLPCIYSTSSKVGDPNFDNEEKSIYKKDLEEYIKYNDIKFLIDLHGCWSERNFAIELGTGGNNHKNLKGNSKLLKIINESLNKNLKTYLQHNKKEITTNTIFPASNKNTISNYISNKTDIPTIQIEINYDLRDKNKPENINKLISTLEELIIEIKEYLKC